MSSMLVEARCFHRAVTFALLGYVIFAVPGLRADATAVPLANSQVEQDPYKFTGVILAGVDVRGSGAVVRHPNIMVSCAHVVYDDETLLDPWLNEVRWFWKYHASAEPLWENGIALRGYTQFTSYQFAAEVNGSTFPGTFAWDVVAHYAYESLANGENGGWWANGLSALSSSDPKMITGYPAGIYPLGNVNRNKMHVTGPFSNALEVDRGAYLGADGVVVGSGNSGGPVWVKDTAGAWRFAGVYVSGSEKRSGYPVNSIGVRAMDDDAWSLVRDAIAVTPPPNDNFARSTVISGLINSVAGSNVGATKEADEPDHADDPGGKSVWWTWTAPADQTVTFHTIGSSFDTVLAVYTGNAASNLVLISSDDESGENGASIVSFPAVSGTVYHIAVDGFAAASGDVVLNLELPPPNDDFAARIPLAGPKNSVSGSNVGATKETGEPNHASRSGGTSVWWTWTAPTSGIATVDTLGSSFDTLLAVYRGNSVSSLTLVASNNDNSRDITSRLTFAGVAGTAYHIAVDGLFGVGGHIMLNIRQGLYLAAQPQSRSVVAGGNATFSVTASGTSVAKYQWRKDGVDISGTTNSAYAITNIHAIHGGAYSVLVTDSVGSVASSNAALIVTVPYTFTTLAGSPGYGSADGTGSEARFYAPGGVAVDLVGNVFVADSGNYTVRKITPDGVVSTLAGLAGTRGNADGAASVARFNFPTGVAVDNAGNVYVADTLNNTIRKITAAGTVTTLAGSLRTFSGSTDGFGTTARFFAPNRLAVDASGTVYVSDTLNHTIRKITSGGVVSTLAGKAGVLGSADGTGTTARFAYPRSVAVDAAGNIYVADSGNDTIRKITPSGVVSTFAGLTGNGGSTDGPSSVASFTDPVGVAMDAAGTIYVADDYAHTIRKITPDGIVGTLAGLAGSGG